jgi:hypothetical protein
MTSTRMHTPMSTPTFYALIRTVSYHRCTLTRMALGFTRGGTVLVAGESLTWSLQRGTVPCVGAAISTGKSVM